MVCNKKKELVKFSVADQIIVEPIIEPEQMTCPDDNPNYQLVKGKCYYIEKAGLTWEKAKEGCKDKFKGKETLYIKLTLTLYLDNPNCLAPPPLHWPKLLIELLNKQDSDI